MYDKYTCFRGRNKKSKFHPEGHQKKSYLWNSRKRDILDCNIATKREQKQLLPLVESGSAHDCFETDRRSASPQGVRKPENSLRISDTRTYKLNSSQEKFKHRCVSTYMELRCKCNLGGNSSGCWKSRPKRCWSFKRLPNQFLYQLDGDTHLSNQVTCLEHYKNFRYTHLQAQFFTREAQTLLSFNLHGINM